jgi:hypothetical protein
MLCVPIIMRACSSHHYVLLMFEDHRNISDDHEHAEVFQFENVCLSEIFVQWKIEKHQVMVEIRSIFLACTFRICDDDCVLFVLFELSCLVMCTFRAFPFCAVKDC